MWSSFEDFPGSQWLRLCAPNAGGRGSIPGQWTKILNAMQKRKKKKKSEAICYYKMEWTNQTWNALGLNVIVLSNCLIPIEE